MASVSILLFAYNHEAFIEAALMSALRQDITGQELVIVDDASTDRTRTIIQQVLTRELTPGLKVTTLFHERNLGLLAAANAGMGIATGEIFLVMAGDDISMPDRLRRTAAIFDENPRVQLVYGETEIIDEKGRTLRAPAKGVVGKYFDYSSGSFGRIYAGSLPSGASAAYRRNSYDVFGPMGPGSHAEDNCYWVRALLLGVIYRDPACLIQHRRHASNISNYAVTSGSEWRVRHLATMVRHASFSGQWLVDVESAKHKGLISSWLAFRLRYAARKEDATWALAHASLRPEPWTLWLQLAWGMFKIGRISTILKMLIIRISPSRREKTWQVLAKVKSNAPI